MAREVIVSLTRDNHITVKVGPYQLLISLTKNEASELAHKLEALLQDMDCGRSPLGHTVGCDCIECNLSRKTM
jgi:hypothetical protein